MDNKCIECENESLFRAAELECELEKEKRYIKLLNQCLDDKDDLCKALREDNQELREKLEIYEKKLKDCGFWNQQGEYEEDLQEVEEEELKSE